MRFRAPIFTVLLLACALVRPALADEVTAPEDIPVPVEAVPEPPAARPEPVAPPEPARTPEPAPVAEAESPWRFDLTVPFYVWVPNFGGVTAIEGDDAAIPWDLSFKDVVNLVFNDLAGIVSFNGEVRWNRIGARSDLYWMEFKRVGLSDLGLSTPDLPLNRQSQLALRMHLHLVLLHSALSYDLYDEEFDSGPFDFLRVTPLLGVRYVYFSGKAVIKDSTIPALIGKTALDAKENYWTLLPFGVEFELGFLGKWSLLANVMAGGWGIGTARNGTEGMGDLLLKYRFKDNWTAQGGMRWLNMDHKGEILDTKIGNAYGPMIKVVWSF